MIPQFFEKLFGINWRTSAFGFISKLAMVGAFISLNPHAFDWLPDSVQGYVTGFFVSLWGVVSLIKDMNTRDKQS